MTAERLKWGLLVATFFCCIPRGLAQPGVQTLTQDDIARSGIARLSDLFALAGAWPATSTEGYHWDAAPIGLGLPEASQLFVDSIAVNVQAIGHHRLNLLPVNLSEICRVEIYSRPALIGGKSALSGAIHLHTCEPTHNLTVRGITAAANETGDPGPWRYTPRASPNVDRSGPILQNTVAWATPRTFVRLQAGLDEHHATDPRIRTRVHTLYRGEKDARIQVRQAQLDVRRAQHRLKLAASQSQDFLYSALLGLEAPVNHDIRYVQLSGRWRPLQYYLKASQNRISTLPNPNDLNVDLDHSSATGQLQSAGAFGNPRISIGLQGTLTQARFQPGTQERMFFQGRAFGQWSSQSSASVESTVFGSIRLDGNIPGFTTLATAILDEAGLDLTITLSHRSHAALPDYPFWLRQGYHPIRPVEFAINQPRATLYSADLSWHSSREHAVYTITGGLRRHVGLQHLALTAQFDPTTTSLNSSGQVTYISGQIGRIAGEFRRQISDRLRTVLHAAFALPFSSQSDYESLWKHRLQLQATADYTPHPRFSMQIRLRFRGVSHWPAYEAAARGSPAHYADRLTPGVFADLTILKRLWHDHLSLSATLRNLVDHDYLHHPAGGRSRLTLHLRLAWNFTALAGADS